MKANILLIDDEDKLRGLLSRIISLEGFHIIEAATLAAARNILSTNNNIDIVLCDVKLPGGNGVDFTAEIKKTYPHLEILLLTAFGNIPDGVKAIKNGASDYLVKGDDNPKIIPILNHLSDTLAQQRQVKKVDGIPTHTSGFEHIIGNSKPVQDAIRLAEKVAHTDTAVLLTGETGTGKEVFAEAIHRNSNRAKKSFISINCSAFSKELLESELFGYKAGAFTGASKDKKGLIEEANGGTLFLDEIGEMSLELQPKLLRLLENGTYFRIGDTHEHRADIRIIAATNRALKQEIESNTFRSDLYYRIAVFNITLAPLRERTDDILPLAQHYLHQFSTKAHKTISSFSKEAEVLLVNSEWRGNIRELKNAIERAVILEDEPILTPSSLPIEVQSTSSSPTSNLQLQHVEKLHIQKVLSYTRGNKSEAARLMDIGLATLYRKLEEYGLK